MKKLRMHYCSKKQMSESFLTAAFLSVSGGLQDMYTYISRGHVFANAQTGNIVLLSQHIFAGNWADVMRYLMPVLSEEEEAVYKRGRNAKSPTMAKNASMSDYRRATGFEALMGYLYLADRFDRILELTVLGLDGLGKEEKTHRS